MRCTITQLAAYCGKSERTMVRWLSSGKLKHKRLPNGLIEVDDALLFEPESGNISAIMEALQRIEEKLDMLAAQVATPTRIVRQPAPIKPVEQDWHEGALPDGLVGYRAFARLHGIAESTVHKAIESGRIQGTIEGEWTVGKAPVRRAFTAEGRREFYMAYRGNPHFIRCADCPHAT